MSLQNHSRTNNAVRHHACALVGYLALTLLLFAPVLPRLNSAILGGPVAAVDGWQHVWHIWWTWQALGKGQAPLFTPLLYHPVGVDLAIHPLNVSNGVLALPLTAAFGPIAGYNFVAMLSFVLGGWAAFALALHVGARPLAAFAGGLVLAFGPFHLTKLLDGQSELVAIQWIACFALCTWLAASSQRWSAALLAAAALATVGYTSLYYLLFCAVLAVTMALLWLPWRAPWPQLLAYLGRLALIPAVAVLLLLPLLMRIAAQFSNIAVVDGADSRGGDFLFLRSANLVDLLLPSPHHPLWGAFAARVGAALHPGIAAWNIALGYTALLLAGAALWLARPVA